ncbi:type VI secretion system baseplate subunit TssK [Sorangium sp. So ce321]|uniref:type VI secretion system baseplate subunit TssK n=1 Tax=Sorangium sp. So ce321 TaxID=3133300 RepID=UPI003F5FA214
MRDVKLALNRWFNGQILQPAHFQAQEEALLGNLSLSSRLPGLPLYGIGELDWDEEGLAKGRVSVRRLTVVFDSGEVFAVPGNATIGTVDIDVKKMGEQATLYLHVLNDVEHVTGADLYARDAPDVERVVHKLALSTSSSVDDARQPLQLAVLRRRMGSLYLSGDYVPPLLQVGKSPFLRALLEEQVDLLKNFEADRRAELRDAALRGEGRASARRCQLAAYRLRTLLADHAREIHLHPYHLLEALRAFYLELCLFQDVEPADLDPETYDHDDLAGCFNRLGDRIAERLHRRPVLSPELVPFQQKEGERLFVAAPLPDALKRAAEVYLLVERPDAYTKAPLRGLKLASPSRLDFVHKRALRGVELTPVQHPPSHAFGSNVDFHVIRRDDEWEQALRDGALAYYGSSPFEAISLSLGWRARVDA